MQSRLRGQAGVLAGYWLCIMQALQAAQAPIRSRPQGPPEEALRPRSHTVSPSPLACPAGNVLIFVHADTRPPPGLLPEALAALRRPQVVLGGFRPVIGETAEHR